MERNQWEIILYVLFAFIMYDLQMNVGWGCYKTVDGLLFIGLVVYCVSFVPNLEGMFPSRSDFCEEIQCA